MKALLSRKFILAVIGLAITGLAYAIPDLRPYAGDIGKYAFALVAAAILGITLEDSATAWAERPKNVAQAVSNVVDEAFDKVIPWSPELEEAIKKVVRDVLESSPLGRISIAQYTPPPAITGEPKA